MAEVVNWQTFVSGADINPVMQARMAQVKTQLSAFAQKSPAFTFNPAGTHLISMMELAYSYAKRADELVVVIECLLKSAELVSGVVLARALTETAAAGTLYVSDMRRLIAAGDLRRLEDRFKKFYAGVRDTDIGPVHVLEAIRHLEAVDNAYYSSLESRYPALKEVMARLVTASGESSDEAVQQLALRVSRNYALLSEVAHPNGLGTQYLYPAPDAPIDEGHLRQRLAFLCGAAIWQCHHLVTALAQAENLPDDYRAAFLN
jgi:hypothetical protein